MIFPSLNSMIHQFRRLREIHFNPDLFILILLLTIMNLRLLTGSTILTWDTYSAFEGFSTVYSEFFYHNELPFWFPYSIYGLPDYGTVSGLSIVNFLFIGIGKLLTIENAMLLFRVSLFFEQLISLTGVYLLANAIFTKRITVMAVCLSMMATYLVYVQVVFNFRQVYLLPLILFWIVLFFKRKRPEFIWLTGLTVLFSLPGSAYYPLIIGFYAIALFAVVLFLFDVHAISAIFKRSWSSAILLFSLVVSAGLFFYYSSFTAQGVEFFRPGRSADLSVLLKDYLNYWSSWSILDLGVAFFYGLVTSGLSSAYEYSFYMGLLPIAGFLAALLYSKKPIWYALFSAIIFLYLVSIRQYLSAIIYYLPLVEKARYIAILGTIPCRSFLILAAGFGMDLDLTKHQLRKIGFLLVGSLFALEVLGHLVTPLNSPALERYHGILSNPDHYTIDFKIFFVRAAGYLFLMLLTFLVNQFKTSPVVRTLPISQLTKIGIVGILILDLALYRANFEMKIAEKQSLIPDSSRIDFTIQPLNYQAQRVLAPMDNKTLALLEYSKVVQPPNAYTMESFLQMDRCVPLHLSAIKRFEVYTFSLKPLLDHDIVLNGEGEGSPAVQQIYGCNNPKIRVVSNILVSDNFEEALQLIEETDDLSNLLILSKEFTDLDSDEGNPPISADIEVLNFTTNSIKIQAHLAGNQTGWLIYSDAYHPSWSAKVNGESRSIERAYLGFKAVRLDPGENVVEFQFRSATEHAAYIALVILYSIAALTLLCGLIFLLFKDPKQLIGL